MFMFEFAKSGKTDNTRRPDNGVGIIMYLSVGISFKMIIV